MNRFVNRFRTMTRRPRSSAIAARIRTARLVANLLVAALTAGASLATPAWAESFLFSTGSPDGRLGALSQPSSAGHFETETADDFNLTATTSITQVTIAGLIPAGTPLAAIDDVEVEIYHVFPKDSAAFSGNVPSRVNSPADVEIDSATRGASQGTLAFTSRVLDQGFAVANTVVDGINPAPANLTHGEGPASGEVVEITITFTPPIVLPADHYFLRPQVRVAGGDFLYLSAPRPIVAPGTPVVGDLQAWIRNADLDPDWLRIGTDIIGGTPPTFNMTLSLAGETVPLAGTPGNANCHGRSVSALAHQFGGIDAAASGLGFSSVAALQDAFQEFCDQ